MATREEPSRKFPWNTIISGGMRRARPLATSSGARAIDTEETDGGMLAVSHSNKFLQQKDSGIFIVKDSENPFAISLSFSKCATI